MYSTVLPLYVHKVSGMYSVIMALKWDLHIDVMDGANGVLDRMGMVLSKVRRYILGIFCPAHCTYLPPYLAASVLHTFPSFLSKMSTA